MGNILEMLLLNKEATEKTILFVTNFQLVVVLVIELEVNHLINAIGIMTSQKIAARKQISVV
jgi:hypothetical protein